MSIEVSSEPQDDYTWETADFTWLELPAERAWDAAHTLLFTVAVARALGMGEGGVRSPQVNASSSWGVSDSPPTFVFQANKLESLGVSSTYIDLIAFINSIHESLSVAETLGKTTVMAAFEEALGLISARASLTTLNQNSGFGLDEAQSRDVVFDRNVVENLAVADALAKTIDHPMFEAVLSFADGLVKTVGNNTFSGLGFEEQASKVSAFSRNVQEAVLLATAQSKSSTHSLEENLSVIDGMIRHANAVLADLSIRSSEVTFDQFKETLTNLAPLGFTDFQRFLTGDYTYQDALFRIEITRDITGDQVQLTDWKLVVDVPDIRNRGTVEVPNTGATITFDRPYNTTEGLELSFVVKSGTGQIWVDIVTITTTGFTIFARTVGTTDAVAATISWTSLGA